MKNEYLLENRLSIMQRLYKYSKQLIIKNELEADAKETDESFRQASKFINIINQV